MRPTHACEQCGAGLTIPVDDAEQHPDGGYTNVSYVRETDDAILVDGFYVCKSKCAEVFACA